MKHYSPIKVGISVSIMIVAIAVLMLWQSGLLIQATGYKLIGKFNVINGLLNGAEVRYRGYKVGTVFDIQPNPETIDVTFYVDGDIKIPEGSTLRVIFDGLIGEKYIDIQPNTEANAYLSDGDSLSGYSTAGLADFVDLASKNLAETQAIFSAFREVFASDEVMASMKDVIFNVEKIVESMSSISTSLDDAQIANIANDVSEISRELSQTTRALRGLITQLEDREVADRVADILDNLDQFTAELSGNTDGATGENGGLGRNIRQISKTLSSVNIKGAGAFRYYVPDENPVFSGDVDVHVQNNFLRAGVNNRWGDVQFTTAQVGFGFSNAITARFGVVQKQAGFGVDFQPIDQLGFSIDAYNFKDMSVDIETRLGLTEYLKLLGGLSRDPVSKSYDNYFFGIMLTP
jgi:phospholipid/cholesterol/gamma-HCH transport system substrate-binding protein